MKIGDVVAARQGGYLMTVNTIQDDKVGCVWFVKDKPYTGTFEKRDLEKWVREANLPEACRAG